MQQNCPGARCSKAGTVERDRARDDLGGRGRDNLRNRAAAEEVGGHTADKSARGHS